MAIINLDKDESRLERMMVFMDAMGLNATRISAVNGRALFENTIDMVNEGVLQLDTSDQSASGNYRGNFNHMIYENPCDTLTPTEMKPTAPDLRGHVGHIKTLEAFESSNKPFLFIFEDDAVPSVKPGEVVTSLYRMFESYAVLPGAVSGEVDLILLHAKPDQANMASNLQLGSLKGKSGSAGSHAYIVATTSIPKIQARGGPPFLGWWDHWWDWDFMGINRYAIEKILFPRGITCSTTDGSTTENT